MTLPELNKAIEQAVADVSVKKAASEKADVIAAEAKTAYVAAVQKIRDLHGEYQKVMQEILSFGGSQHVAPVR